MKRVLICGDRTWSDEETMRDAMAKLEKGDIIIEGGCRGADLMAGGIAVKLGLQFEEFPADWNAHGARAGPIRNKKMIEEGRPDVIWIFHDDALKPFGKGTQNMVNQALKTKKPIILFNKWLSEGAQINEGNPPSCMVWKMKEE